MSFADFPKDIQEDLLKSGLNERIVAENGLRVVPPDEFTKIEPYHVNKIRCILEFPYHHLSECEPFSRVRLYPPVLMKDGKYKKYSQPIGTANHLYIPKSVSTDLLQDVSVTIIIGEGEKKVLKAWQEGLGVVIGVSGVWSWLKAGIAIADMDLIAWAGRACIICFDSDTWLPGKEDLRKALYALGKELEARGAIVEFVLLPDGFDGEKIGLDDFLLTRPIEAFFSLPRTNTSDRKHFKGIRAWWSEWKKDHSSKKGVDFYELVARHILDTNIQTPIIYIPNDGFYRYDKGGFYRALSREMLSVEIRCGIRSYQKATGLLDGKPIEAKRALRAEIEDAIRDVLLRIQPNSQLNKSKDILNVENGLFDLSTMKLSPHSPDAHFTMQFNAKYDVTAECPLWKNTLSDIFTNDDEKVRGEKIEILRRFFGLCLIPDQSFQKILVLIGEGANGKSLALGVLMGILGHDNYSSVAIDQLVNPFYLSELQNKLVNISSEINAKNAVADALVKKLSGEDSITADRKFQHPVKFFSIARLIFSMNEIPLIEDRTHAFYRRILVVEFTRTFQEKEQQRDLRERLLIERDGIFLWMLSGLLDLRKDGRFPDSEVLRAAVMKFKRENNTVMAFAEQWLEEAELGLLTKGAVYAAYKEWCEQNGKRPFASNKFSSLLRKAVPGFGSKDDRDGGIRVWNGISFSGEVDQEMIMRFSRSGSVG